MSAANETHPHRLAKKTAFLARMAEKSALRKLPGHCCRCAKPHRGPARQCPACTAYAAEYRAKKLAATRGVMVDSQHLTALERRIGNLEHYFARLSEVSRVSYKRGYVAGRRLHRAADERASYYGALPSATAQELAEISHEFRR